MTTNLHTRYRPQSLDEVIGQAAVIKMLRQAIKKDDTHTFAFIGPAGVGKTTLARIVARDVGCRQSNILEVDGATVTGIDAMRTIMDTTRYHGFGDSIKKAVIIDEFHRLSGAAFDSLLKSLEEPPEHLYWFLCTTAAGKVPTTIKTRCLQCNLKPVDDKAILGVLQNIVEQERIKIDEDVLDFCVRQAQGSVRQAISFLAACRGIDNLRDARLALDEATEGKTVIDLCRFILWPQPLKWEVAAKYLAPLREENAESLRIIMLNYFNAVLVPRDPKKEPAKGKNAFRAMEVMQHFIEPFPQQNGFASITMAVSRALFGGGTS